MFIIVLLLVSPHLCCRLTIKEDEKQQYKAKTQPDDRHVGGVEESPGPGNILQGWDIFLQWNLLHHDVPVAADRVGEGAPAGGLPGPLHPRCGGQGPGAAPQQRLHQAGGHLSCTLHPLSSQEL